MYCHVQSECIVNAQQCSQAELLVTGQIQAVAWAIRQKNGAQPAACEIFLITMSVSETSADASLKVETVQLMQVASMICVEYHFA